jgi:hypothetical protein
MTQHRRLVPAALSLAVAACGGGGTPATTSMPAAASALPTVAPDPTPSVSTVDGVAVTTTSLGISIAPIDVVSAFGSLWVAAHHQNTVIRIDPATMEPIATIKVASGPGWFVTTNDAVWVSSQMARGLTRIDPATNTGDVRAGTWAACGAPVMAAGSIWQMACDSGQLMRIDPTSYQSIDITAADFTGVGLVGETLIATGPDGLYTVDTDKNRLKKRVAAPGGFAVGYDDTSVWIAAADGVHRVAIEDGSEIGLIPLSGDLTVTFAGDHGWLTVFGGMVHEIDLSTTSIARTLHLDGPAVAREIDDVVWVTSFDSNGLSRFTP